MTVYVDELWECGPVPTFPYKYGCHMLADTDGELHAMALKIGLQLRWQHNEHFDITPSKRALAIRYGAAEMPTDLREKVALIRRLRDNALRARTGQPGLQGASAASGDGDNPSDSTAS